MVINFPAALCKNITILLTRSARTVVLALSRARATQSLFCVSFPMLLERGARAAFVYDFETVTRHWADDLEPRGAKKAAASSPLATND